MDTPTLIEELKKLKTDAERIAFIETELQSNPKFKEPFYGNLYAANPTCLLYLLRVEEKITPEAKALYYSQTREQPAPPETFDWLAGEVNKMRGL